VKKRRSTPISRWPGCTALLFLAPPCKSGCDSCSSCYHDGNMIRTSPSNAPSLVSLFGETMPAVPPSSSSFDWDKSQALTCSSAPKPSKAVPLRPSCRRREAPSRASALLALEARLFCCSIPSSVDLGKNGQRRCHGLHPRDSLLRHKILSCKSHWMPGAHGCA
jgi:hypothetical protein